MLTYYIQRLTREFFVCPVGYLACALVTVYLISCNNKSALCYVLESADDNHSQLEAVLEHYRTVDPNPDKLRAAEYLISSLPAHYSYSGSEIHEYYDYADRFLADTALTPEQQRDSLLAHFGKGLEHPIKNDVEYNTIMGVADMLRNDAYNGLHRYGLYTRAGLPLLTAHLQTMQTYGNIPDYAMTAVLLMRSAGIPAVLDETPVGSRGTAATSWDVCISFL
ncbi:MAG TPA: hypothetical protein VFC94_05300 [Bacteroidaceae bacterium]|nr:hypothetical protein [Bacteroidaceae bacterium]